MKKHCWLNLSILVLLLLLLAFPIRTVQSAPNPKIEPAILDRFAAAGSADIIVHFNERADLSPAFGMDWHERGWFVYEALQATAARSQERAIDLVKGRRLDYHTVISANSLYVYGVDLATADALAALPEVTVLRAPRTYYLAPALETALQEQPQDLTWGVIDIQADEFWSTLGLQGEGIVVANIDSGVAYQHDALDQAYKCQADPGDAACWYDPTNTCPTAPCDDFGRGTATMGLMVADDDAALPCQAGVAPGAQWIACKACGSSGGCDEQALNLCADWLLAPGGDPDNRPAVVFDAAGSPAGCNDWFLAQVQAWVAAGIVPVSPPGHSGPACSTLGSPGDYQECFAGTAHDVSRNSHAGASRGPSCFGHDPYTKPNISAPGVGIQIPIPPNDWTNQTSTGFSSAYSAGAVALLWSCAPQLRGQVYATFEALQDTADTPPPGNCDAPPDGEGNYTYGYGYLNILAAGLAYCAQGPGTLDGHVYDAATAGPIAGATVTAVPGPVQGITDAQGYYSMTLDAGPYTVTAAATGYHSNTASVAIVAGLTTTHDLSLTAATSLVPAFSSDSPVCMGVPMHFTDTSTANPPVSAWFWDFGDGVGTSVQQYPTYTYSAADDYTVTLWVTNSAGISWTMDTVTVHALPAASFAHYPPAGPVPLTVYFTNTSQNAVTPTWDLGDGFGDAGDQVNHTYAMTGTYYVTLTVDSPYGCGADTAGAAVTAYESATCLSVTIVSVNQAALDCVVTLSATLAGDPPFTYTWDMGPFGNLDVPTPTVDLGETGTYTGTLDVWNCDGQGHDMVVFSLDAICEPSFHFYLPLLFRGAGP